MIQEHPMEAENNVEILGDLFRAQRYKDAIMLFEESPELHFDQVSTEENAEIALIISFSHYYDDNLSRSLAYSLPLARHMERLNQMEAAGEWYQDLLYIIFASYVKLDKKWTAYFFLRGRVRNVRVGLLTTEFGALKATLTPKIFNFLEFILCSLGGTLFIVQSTLKPLGPVLYLLLILFFVVSILATIFVPQFFRNLIKKLL